MKTENDALSFTRLRDWFADPQRKPALLSFTEGHERNAAYAFEAAQASKPAPEPVGTEALLREAVPYIKRCAELTGTEEIEAPGGLIERIQNALAAKPAVRPEAQEQFNAVAEVFSGDTFSEPAKSADTTRMHMTNPTPSLGLSSPEAPSPAALAATPRVDKMMYQEDTGYNGMVMVVSPEDARTLERELNAAAQLVETNAKALAHYSNLADEHANQADLLNMQLAQSQARVEEVEAQLNDYKRECDLMLHKVLACGVIASHPDATLGDRPPYSTKWNSQQANYVRALRKRADESQAREKELAAALKKALELCSVPERDQGEDWCHR